ncbi:EamA family transporter RarD [Aliiroseovarius sp.]|uniref:EamA family transporter RarD n=1 Tax=Aliiroseovarius sp. TaxID=1872442 RepID=UPI00262C6FE6|nr:EamA family transporter RarD [Aliiroseovarius sp.]
MSETKKGILAMVAACVIWGFVPLYYALLSHVPPLEVLSHRTLWSLVLFGVLLSVQGRLGELPRILLTWRGFLLISVASLMVSTNWGVFILSVQIGKVVESSLGYFIFPLVAVVLGRLVYGERLSAVKWLSVGIASAAVVLLTVGLGVAPWISLILAFTFGLYGVIKKALDAGPVVSVTGEVLVLAPLAAVWLAGVHLGGWEGVTGRNGAVFGQDLRDSLVLIGSGLTTAGPLILFSYASRRLNLSTVGLLQYINPSLQFFCAVVILGEAVTPWHLIAFPMIWAALALFSADAIRQDRASRRARRS